jgi:hypothetical protein
MSETLSQTMEPDYATKRIVVVEPVGKVSVLEALAEESDAISINASQRSTQVGNGSDAQDD